MKYSPGSHRLPGCLYIRIQILLRGLAATHPIAGVIVAKYVAIDLGAQGQIEAAHLAQIDGIPVGEEQRVLRVLAAPDIDAGDQVATRGACEEGLHLGLLPLRVLPLSSVEQLQVVADVGVVRRSQFVCGFRWLEGQLGRNGTRTWGAAKHATELADTEHARTVAGSSSVMPLRNANDFFDFFSTMHDYHQPSTKD